MTLTCNQDQIDTWLQCKTATEMASRLHRGCPKVSPQVVVQLRDGDRAAAGVRDAAGRRAQDAGLALQELRVLRAHDAAEHPAQHLQCIL